MRIISHLKNFILGVADFTIECEEDYLGFTVMSNHTPVFRSTNLSLCWYYIANSIRGSEDNYLVEGEPSTKWFHQMVSKGLIDPCLLAGKGCYEPLTWLFL